MDRSDYIAEGNRELSDTNFYTKVDTDLIAQHMLVVQGFITKMYLDGEIDETVSFYLNRKRKQNSQTLLTTKNT